MVESFLERDLYAYMSVVGDSAEEVGIGNVETEERWESVSWMFVV